MRVLFILYCISVGSPPVTHKMVIILMPNTGHNLFVFWFTATHIADIGYIKILRHRVHGLSPDYLHKKRKRLIKLDRGAWGSTVGLPVCHFISVEMIVEKFRHIDKNRTLDHFVWRRKWYFLLVQRVTSSILPSHHAVSACNCLFCDKKWLCD